MKPNLLTTKQEVQNLVPNYVPQDMISPNVGGGWLVILGGYTAIIVAVDCGAVVQYVWAVEGTKFSKSCLGAMEFIRSWDDHWGAY